MTAGRNGFANSVLKTNVWTRWRCRRCGNNIPTGLQGKHKQAVYAKNEGWCSGSSSSSGGEEGKSQDQDEEIEKMRAHVELLRKQQRVGKRPKVQGEPTRRGSDADEVFTLLESPVPRSRFGIKIVVATAATIVVASVCGGPSLSLKASSPSPL